MTTIPKGELIFVRILFPLLAGISVAAYLPGTVFFRNIALLTAVLFLCGLWFSLITYTKYKIYLNRWKPGFFVHAFVFFAAIAITLINNPKIDNSHFSKSPNDAFIVRVISEPNLKGDIVRFEAEIKQGLENSAFKAKSGLLLVALKIQSNTNYKYGDELLIRSNYNEVEPPFNPYEFDFKYYLQNRGIYHQTFINESQVKILAAEKQSRIIDLALKLRKKMVDKYSHYIRNAEAASLLSTLILGYKADLSHEVLDAYSKTGTMHVLSVSGMHVGIVFAVLTWMLGFMSRTKKLRIVRAMIIVSLIWFYALITGFSPSVCRAALMLSIYVSGKAINRSSNSYNLVAASAVLLLFYNPWFIFNAGFQLSYLAVLGLIYFYPLIYHLFYFKNWIGDKIWSYIALSCAAQLATFPLALYYFHQFPVYFLFSNLFIVLPVVFIMYGGLAFLFIPWDYLLKPLAYLLEKTVLFMDNGLFLIEHLPHANILSYNVFIYYLLMYLIIAAFVLALQTKNKQVLLFATISTLVFVTYRSTQELRSLNKSSITLFSLRKHTAVAFFKYDKAGLYSDMDSSDKTMLFSVSPSLQAQADVIQYLGHGAIQKDFIFSDGNFFQFKNWKLMIYDGSFKKKTYRKTILVDAVLISGNPKVKLKEILKNVRTKMIAIDGTNSDYSIRLWEQEARLLSLNLQVLKKRPALSIILDE